MPGKPEMTYEELMSVYRQESRQTTLSKVPSDFYQRVTTYLDALDRRCSESKSGADISGMLLSQLKTAKEKSAGVYEIRMRKLVLMAMSSAFGAEPRLENATPEELKAFESIKSYFIEHRRQTLSPKCDESVPQEPRLELAGAAAASQPIGENPPVMTAKSSDEKRDTVLVRILEDLPVIAGEDKNYQLAKEDVIDLPRRYAEILLKNNKAVEIRHSLQ
ncbi:MAG: hypothetical protein QXE18_03265 [Thermoplasmata archaeon]